VKGPHLRLARAPDDRLAVPARSPSKNTGLVEFFKKQKLAQTHSDYIRGNNLRISPPMLLGVGKARRGARKFSEIIRQFHNFRETLGWAHRPRSPRKPLQKKLEVIEVD
jgi:hypothetical protein